MTKRRQKILVSVIAFFLAAPSLLVVWLAWTGFFTDVKVTETTLAPMFMVYEEHTGPYGGTEDIMKRISNLLEKDNIETTKGFGIYLDDPKLTALDSLRSIAGRIIESGDTSKIKSLGSAYRIMRLPSKRYAVAEIKNRGALSAFAGSVKVYAALDRFMKENEFPLSPTMEIYDRNKTIRYLREIKE